MNIHAMWRSILILSLALTLPALIAYLIFGSQSGHAEESGKEALPAQKELGTKQGNLHVSDFAVAADSSKESIQLF